jgi:hypothetical protein
MWSVYEIDVAGDSGRREPVFRYDVLERLARLAARYGVRTLAYGFVGPSLRVVLEGGARASASVARGLTVAVRRAWAARGAQLVQAPPALRFAESLEQALAWVHAPEAGGDPLRSPWSSHRELLGLRRTGWVDLGVVRGRVDPDAVHRAAGGSSVVHRPATRAEDPRLRDPGFLLRFAAVQRGVLAPDRRCFRLFAHLGRVMGLAAGAIARALALTPRRIRQLWLEPEPDLPLALLALGTPASEGVP